MPNAIKYNVSAETLALKKGNFWIGTGDVGKGPTSSTGFYNGITPPSGGYTIYLNKETSGPSIYTVTTEAQLTGLTSTIAGQTLTTSGACLNWFATQTDKMIFNIDYPAIVTNGLVLNLDAGFTPSYPTTNTTWYDVSSGGNNGTLTNGPTFNSSNGGSIVFDGVDDYVDCGNSITFAQGFTLFILFKTTASTLTVMAGKFSGAPNDFWVGVLSNGTLRFSISMGGKREPTSTTVINTGNWYLGTVIYNPSTFAASLYVNGNIEQTVIGDTLFLEPNPPFVLGNFPGQNFFFPGSIAISQVYNRALTAAEVLQNYNALKGRFGL
jgi:hypothetical protein